MTKDGKDDRRSDGPITVGDLRKAMEGLPDDAPVSPIWAYGPPGDADPGISVEGCRAQSLPPSDQLGLGILVDLFYLDEDDEDDEDDK